jgi:hypothetical protein
VLKVRYFRPGSLSPETCRRLWRLRLDNIGLKPEVDPEADYRSFAGYFNGGTTAVTFWDSSGELQGFYGWNEKVLRVEETDVLRIILEYAFINPRYRGRPEFLLAALRLGVPLLLRHAGAIKVAGGIAYPGSYVAAKQVTGRVVTFSSPSLTPALRRVLEDIASELGGDGYDRATGLVRMRTLPVVHRKVSARPSVRSALAEYEAENPRWKEGYGLPVCFELDWGAVAVSARRLLASALGGGR